MPLLLLVPLLAAGLLVLWALLFPLAVVQRYRFGKARRRVQPWFVRLNAWLLAASTILFIAFAGVMDRWVDGAFLDAIIGLAIGGAVGLLGLAVDRFESTSQGIFRTPNRWLVLALSLLVAARIAIGLWLAWSDGPPTGATAWVTRGGLVGVGGVLLGYALATGWGLRFRVAGVTRQGRR
jgi:hypothetical protein